MSPKPRGADNRGLPARWRLRYGRYYYRPRDSERAAFDGRAEFRLGRTLGEAYRVFGERMEWLDEINTIDELCNRYLMEVMPHKAPATQRSQARSMQRIRAALGHNAVPVIEPVHIYRYRDAVAKKYSQKAANLDLELLSHMFTKALEWGARRDHPMTGKKVVKYSLAPRDRYVEDWELRAAMSIAPPLIACYVPLKLLTGLRKGELLSIRLSDMTQEGIQVARSKGGRPVVYEWTPELQAAVEAVKKLRRRVKGLHLFSTRTGQPYIDSEGLTSGFDSIWQRFMAKALRETALEQRFTEHDLRAKVGSEAENVARAQELLGHTTAGMTQRVYRRKVARIKPTR